jgi:hypothetical protein
MHNKTLSIAAMRFLCVLRRRGFQIARKGDIARNDNPQQDQMPPPHSTDTPRPASLAGRYARVREAEHVRGEEYPTASAFRRSRETAYAKRRPMRVKLFRRRQILPTLTFENLSIERIAISLE